MMTMPIPDYDLDAGEAAEIAEDAALERRAYEVRFFGAEYRAFPPVSPPRVQICPNCGLDVREERRDLWRCQTCGFEQDDRPLIRSDMPRRKPRKKKVPRCPRT